MALSIICNSRAPSATLPAGNIAVALARAELGNVDAYHELGEAYASGGCGLARDPIEAHKWFDLAIAGGHPDAQQARAEVARVLTAREVCEAQSRARLWLVVNQSSAA